MAAHRMQIVSNTQFSKSITNTQSIHALDGGGGDDGGGGVDAIL